MQPVCLHAAQCAAAPDLCRLQLAGQRYAFAAATAAPAAAEMAATASMALGRRWYRPPAAVAISLAKPRLMYRDSARGKRVEEEQGGATDHAGALCTCHCCCCSLPPITCPACPSQAVQCCLQLPHLCR